MVMKAPLPRETTIPPIIAVIIPAEGGKPEAIEIPKHSGNAIRKTRKPESKSFRQCAFKPAKPVAGKNAVALSFIKISFYSKKLFSIKRLTCHEIFLCKLLNYM